MMYCWLNAYIMFICCLSVFKGELGVTTVTRVIKPESEVVEGKS